MIRSMVTNENRVGPVYITRDVLLTDPAGQQLSGGSLKTISLFREDLFSTSHDDQSFHDLPDVRLQTRRLADGTLRFEKDDVVNLKVLPVYTTMLINRTVYRCIQSARACRCSLQAGARARSRTLRCGNRDLRKVR